MSLDANRSPSTPYEAVIGLEVHAELQTRAKMFCACPVVDSTQAPPNTTVCPVCAGMPGVLPVVNRQAVEYALRVALALDCAINPTSLFARKNYFYPDLPKGYQISQYEYPLAQFGRLVIPLAGSAERAIRIRRVHLEEDTGKLTHVAAGGNGGEAREAYSLVDLNRAGVPLLEIVSEPDLRTLEEMRAYAMGLRAVLRCLGVNSGDMEKGVIRFEANVSVRPVGSAELGTRVEIKNLNSFRALERSCAYEIERQSKLLRQGGAVRQETLGWNEALSVTYAQRSKEEAHDYRYFPEPDLPPLVIDEAWIERVRAGLPELPFDRARRFQEQHELPPADAFLLVADKVVADYFEACAAIDIAIPPKTLANWVSGEIFAWLNQSGARFEDLRVSPSRLVELIQLLGRAEINLLTAKSALVEMLNTGKPAAQIIQERGFQMISDSAALGELVRKVLAENPKELTSYLSGKETLANWFFGQVMRLAKGQANPFVVRTELERQLKEKKDPPPV